jgi:hypothetical protein
VGVQSGIARAPGARNGRRFDAMDETTTRSLVDEDIQTVRTGTASTVEERPRDEDGTDSKDADGTDGDAKDMKDGDATDSKDADGTDSQDSDGTDTPS